MSHTAILVHDIREGLRAFGLGHSTHRCRACDGQGFRTLAISLWHWRWNIRCDTCQGTGWHPLGDPRGLSLKLLEHLDRVQFEMERREAIVRILRDFGVRREELPGVCWDAGRRRFPHRSNVGDERLMP